MKNSEPSTRDKLNAFNLGYYHSKIKSKNNPYDIDFENCLYLNYESGYNEHCENKKENCKKMSSLQSSERQTSPPEN